MNWFSGNKLHRLSDTGSRPGTQTTSRQGLIVGTGRCGTTILAQILNNHTHIVVPPELQFIIRLHGTDIKHLGAEDIASLIKKYCPNELDYYFDYRAYLSVLQYPVEDLSVFLKGFFHAICQYYGKSILLEQTPWHGQYLPLLNSLFSGLCVIHMVRDPRDVVLSFMRTPYWGDITFEVGIRRWEKEVLRIRHHGQLMGRRFIEIRYEDLILSPRETLTGIIDVLDLNYEEAILDPDRLIDYRAFSKDAASSLKYQSPGYLKWMGNKQRLFFYDNVHGWKKHPDYTCIRKTAEIIGKTMAMYGYEV